jgi:hypothetical protein
MMEDSHSVVFEGLFDRMFCCSYSDHQLDGEDSSIISYGGVNANKEKPHHKRQYQYPSPASCRLSTTRIIALDRRHRSNGNSSTGSTNSKRSDHYSRSTGDMTTAFGMEQRYAHRQQQHHHQQQHGDHMDDVVFFDPREPMPASSSSIMSQHQMELYHRGAFSSASMISARTSASQRSIGTDTTAPCSSNGSCEVTTSNSSSSSSSSASTATTSESNNSVSSNTTSGDDEDNVLRDSSLTFGSTSSASFATRETFDPSQSKHDNPRHYMDNDDDMIKSNNNRKKLQQGRTTRVGMSSAAALEAAKARSRLLRETREAEQQKRCNHNKNSVRRDRGNSSSYKCKADKKNDSSSRYKKRQQHGPVVLLGELEPRAILGRIQSESLSELRLLSQTEGHRC